MSVPENAPKEYSLPLDLQINALFIELNRLFEFSHEEIILRIRDLTEEDKKLEAIHSTYHRMYLWIGTLRLLNLDFHFQAIASGARTLFELYLDMRFLNEDILENGVDKFHAYPDVARYEFAKKSKNICKDHGLYFNEMFKYRQNLLNLKNKENDILALKKRLWGREQKFDNWTGLKLPDRAKILGPETLEMYLWFCDYCNWFIHSGSAGYASVDRNFFNSFSGYLIMQINKMFFEATKLCIHSFPNFNSTLIHELESIDLLTNCLLNPVIFTKMVGTAHLTR